MLAGEGGEEAARLGQPAVEHGRRGHRHGAVALHHPADDRGDLAKAERDHDLAAREAGVVVVHASSQGRHGVAAAYPVSDTAATSAAFTGAMTNSEPTRTANRRARSLAPASLPAVPATGLTVYGCEREEAVFFRQLAPGLGVLPAITEAAVSEANIGLADGNRCISVGHKAQVANSTLLALSRVGVRYISTRSIGYNHINVEYAESIGLTVGNVAYSPDSVADYTLMLMLMAVRDAKSTIRRVDAYDYRLSDVRGKNCAI